MAYDSRFNLAVTVKDSITGEQYISKTSDITALSTSRTKYIAQGYTIATAIANQPVSLNDMTTANDILLVTDQVISVRINNILNAAISFDTKFVIQGGAVTSLFVSNASGSTANFYMIAVGV
jgi:hypothetical protein